MKISHYCTILLCIVALGGCGKGNSNAPVTIDPVTQKHSVGWAANGTGGLHPAAFFSNPAGCQECHGVDLGGGISGVSCSNPGRSGVNCHATFPHVSNFAVPTIHGADTTRGAMAAASQVGGMLHCQACHGTDYAGKGLAPSCIACHRLINPTTNAPHAGKWASYLANPNHLNHSATHQSNAPACAQCHTNKNNLSAAGAARVAQFTTPGVGGCFNNTLCHNQAGHTIPYIAKTDHGAVALNDIGGCAGTSCHSNSATPPRFNVDPSNGADVNIVNGCETCHTGVLGAGTGLAHPVMWLPGRGTTPATPGALPSSNTGSHTSAGQLQAACGLCHGGNNLNGIGGSAPSCMTASVNGTVCHFTVPAVANISVGCTSCHGNPPNDTTATPAAPNRAYRHTQHFATATYNIAGLACSACHSGFGSPGTRHATMAAFAVVSTAIDPKFYESNGVAVTRAAYTPATGLCANVSCHGGKLNIAFGPGTFPAWKSATVFNSLNTCFNCHYQRFGATVSLTEAGYRAAVAAGTKPYIGPFSGNVSPSASLQNLHEGHYFLIGGTPPTLCLKCHPDPGTAHFAHVMDGRRDLPRGFAIVGGSTTAIGTYDSVSGSCLTAGAAVGLSCHDSGSRIWH